MYCLNVLYRFKEEKRKLWEESVFRIIRPDLLSQEKQESTESVWVHYRLRGTNVSAAVRDVVQISTLALSFRSQALLAIGWIFISPLKEKKVKIVVGVFYFFFFFPPPPPLIALSSPSALAIFGPQLFVLASAQKKEVPFQKRAIGMMGRQFFSKGKCYSFFPSKGKLKYNKIKSLDNVRRHQHHWSCHRN